jgi:hypothetical protein
MGDRVRAFHEFRQLAIAAGARDLPRVLASGRLAVQCGDRPVDVIASLQRNRPEFFSERKALRKWRKAQYQNAG